MGEMRIDLARVHRPAFSHEREQRVHPPPPRRAPRLHAVGRHRGLRARMHQRLQLAGDEAVGDEEVFLDAELGIAPFEIAGVIALHAMAEDQVLRPRRGSNRVGLHEPHAVKRACQRGRREQRAGDGKSPKLVERDHRDRGIAEFLSNS